jgi:hypothetical protein
VRHPEAVITTDRFIIGSLLSDDDDDAIPRSFSPPISSQITSPAGLKGFGSGAVAWFTAPSRPTVAFGIVGLSLSAPSVIVFRGKHVDDGVQQNKKAGHTCRAGWPSASCRLPYARTVDGLSFFFWWVVATLFFFHLKDV